MAAGRKSPRRSVRNMGRDGRTAQAAVESALIFFSSRSRHTRCWRDWSSDVCSSDLGDDVSRLGELKELRVVQTLSAGTDWIEDRLPEAVTLCSARGARDVPVSEWVVGALLGAWTGPDRKRVGGGKRVDLGGCRITEK